MDLAIPFYSTVNNYIDNAAKGVLGAFQTHPYVMTGSAIAAAYYTPGLFVLSTVTFGGSVIRHIIKHAEKLITKRLNFSYSNFNAGLQSIFFNKNKEIGTGSAEDIFQRNIHNERHITNCKNKFGDICLSGDIKTDTSIVNGLYRSITHIQINGKHHCLQTLGEKEIGCLPEEVITFNNAMLIGGGAYGLHQIYENIPAIDTENINNQDEFYFSENNQNNNHFSYPQNGHDGIELPSIASDDGFENIDNCYNECEDFRFKSDNKVINCNKKN